jgi:hypothetical protein
MGRAVYRHPRPAVHDDVDVRGRDVRVRVDEVLPQVAGVELWRVDGVFLSLDVDCVLDRVGGDYNAVVRLCVAKKQSVGGATFYGRYQRCSTYDVSILPSSKQHTVISVTDWTPVFSSLWTLQTRTLSLP